MTTPAERDDRITRLPDWINSQQHWADKNAELFERIPHTHALYQRPALIKWLAIEEANRLNDLARMMGCHGLEVVPEELRHAQIRSKAIYELLAKSTSDKRSS